MMKLGNRMIDMVGFAESRMHTRQGKCIFQTVYNLLRDLFPVKASFDNLSEMFKNYHLNPHDESNVAEVCDILNEFLFISRRVYEPYGYECKQLRYIVKKK